MLNYASPINCYSLLLLSSYNVLAMDETGKNYYNKAFYLYTKCKDLNGAEKNYKLAIENGYTEAYNNLATLYMQQGNLKLAEEYYTLALNVRRESKGDVGMTLANLGVLYHLKKNLKLAEQYWLLAVQEKCYAACYNLAIFYSDQNKTDLAKNIEIF